MNGKKYRGIRQAAVACCLVAVFVQLAACGSSGNGGAMDPGAKKNEAPVADYLQQQGDSVLIPYFILRLQLSKLAEDKLAKDKETVIVSALFSGDPKDTTTKEYREAGEMFLASRQLELDTARTARFEGIKFSKTQYEALAGKDIRLLVNVFSGRHSTPDNLLDCEILAGSMSGIKEKLKVLKGKLIAEADALE